MTELLSPQALTVLLLLGVTGCGGAAGSPGAPAAPQPTEGGTRYLAGPIHSPITPAVADRLRPLFAQGGTNGLKPDVFFKAGDSITVGDAFMGQFRHPRWDPATMHGWDDAHDLGAYQSLEAARAHFRAGRIGTASPYERVSLAARVGMDGPWALEVPAGGGLCPLEAELEASQGAFGVIMFGTNDFYPNGLTDAETYGLIVGSTFQLLDRCLAAGAVPLLTAPPPDPVEPTAMRRSRMTSRLLRAAAQGRQVPFLDYYASLLDLPSYGLQANDVHPTSLDYNRAAFLTVEGLQYGYNMRNLVTLQALDRVYRLLVQSGAAPDPEPAGLRGLGTAADPYLVDGTDFSDYQAPAGGRTEVFYRVTVSGAGETWQFAAAGHTSDVFGLELRDGGGALLNSSAEGALTHTLAAGSYTLRVSFPATAELAFAAVEGSCR